ncbi:hypothetical protein [Planosporangium mesophilum]|uniref:Uncharacterized protein n=1 Tax=Planosporangium mesophilum TaxID=689768 RepID=A0A8J3TG09_9ACTN|nr:hypothetical protein [Planosporangium mesophilum]NJC82371.1 hypothetical protein [Planosporangium mesophilum]GII24886.1 hypothetical protein Pme01_44830 [Planosporangium mesophilum]
MSTGVDVIVRRLWWAVPELIAVAVLAALVFRSVPAEPALSSAALRDSVAGRVAAAIERASPAEHAGHGHAVDPDDRMLCTVEVFGVDPSGTTRPSKVTRAYGYYLCAVGRPGTPYLESRLSSGPVVASISDRVRVTMVASGENYREQVHLLMPRYERQAVAGFSSQDKPAQLQRRFELSVTAGSPAAR